MSRHTSRVRPARRDCSSVRISPGASRSNASSSSSTTAAASPWSPPTPGACGRYWGRTGRRSRAAAAARAGSCRSRPRRAPPRHARGCDGAREGLGRHEGGVAQQDREGVGARVDGLRSTCRCGVRERRRSSGRPRAAAGRHLEDRSSGETTEVSQPGSARAASRTSSSIARVSAPRSRGQRARPGATWPRTVTSRGWRSGARGHQGTQPRPRSPGRGTLLGRLTGSRRSPSVLEEENRRVHDRPHPGAAALQGHTARLPSR